MRPSLPTLRGWSADGLRTEGARLRSAAEQLERIAHEVAASIDSHAPRWTGDAADSARESVAAERSALLSAADRWSSAAQSVSVSAGHIGELRARTLRLVDAATEEGLRVDATGGVSVGRPGSDLVAWVRALALAPVFAHQIAGLLGAIDQADQEAATAIASAAGDDVDAVALLASAPDGDGDVDLSQPGADGFRLGAPDRPDIEWDEDYIWGSESSTRGDWASAARWKAKMAGARVLRSDLGDALDAYAHYWDNNGELFTIDYERAFTEDSGIQANVTEELARAAAGADRMASAGAVSFAMTGAASGTTSYPVTENWQKTVGGYQQWSSADVVVSGDTVTMTVTVHAEDYYNFNRGQADIASAAPDDENGRFTEIGWAKPFPTSGSLTRTVTWPLGDPASAVTSVPSQTEGDR